MFIINCLLNGLLKKNSQSNELYDEIYYGIICFIVSLTFFYMISLLTMLVFYLPSIMIIIPIYIIIYGIIRKKWIDLLAIIVLIVGVLIYVFDLFQNDYIINSNFFYEYGYWSIILCPSLSLCFTTIYCYKFVISLICGILLIAEFIVSLPILCIILIFGVNDELSNSINELMKDKDSFSIMCYLTLSMIGLSIILFIIFALGYLAPSIDFAIVFLFFYNCYQYSYNKSFMASENYWKYNVYFFCIFVSIQGFLYIYTIDCYITFFTEKAYDVVALFTYLAILGVSMMINVSVFYEPHKTLMNNFFTCTNIYYGFQKLFLEFDDDDNNDNKERNSNEISVLKYIGEVLLKS